MTSSNPVPFIRETAWRISLSEKTERLMASPADITVANDAGCAQVARAAANHPSQGHHAGVAGSSMSNISITPGFAGSPPYVVVELTKI